MSDKKYTLELTFEEAETLRIVCAHIGGKSETTRRKYMDSIKTKLEDVGVYLNQSENFFEGGYMAGLYFLEEPQKKKMTIEQIEDQVPASLRDIVWDNTAGQDSVLDTSEWDNIIVDAVTSGRNCLEFED